MEDSDEDLFGDDDFHPSLCDDIMDKMEFNSKSLLDDEYCYEISDMKIICNISVEEFSINTCIYSFEMMRNNVKMNSFVLKSFHNFCDHQAQVYSLSVNDCVSDDCHHRFCIVVDESVFTVLDIIPPALFITLPNGAIYACSINKPPIFLYNLNEPIFCIKSCLLPLYHSTSLTSVICILSNDGKLTTLSPSMEPNSHFQTAVYNLPIDEVNDVATKFGHKLWNVAVLGSHSLVGIKIYRDVCDKEIKCSSSILVNIDSDQFCLEEGEFYVVDNYGNMKKLSQFLNNNPIENSPYHSLSCEDILQKIQLKATNLNTLQKRNHTLENTLRQMDLACYLKQLSNDKLKNLLVTSVQVLSNGKSYDLEITIENHLDTQMSSHIWILCVDIQPNTKSVMCASHVKHFRALRQGLKERLMIVEFLNFSMFIPVSEFQFVVSVYLYLCPSNSMTEDFFSKSIPPFRITLMEKNLSIADFLTDSINSSVYHRNNFLIGSSLPTPFDTVNCKVLQSNKQFSLSYEAKEKYLSIIEDLLRIRLSVSPQILYLFQSESNSISLKLNKSSPILKDKEAFLLQMTSSSLSSLIQLFCTVDKFVKKAFETNFKITKECVRRDFANLQNAKLSLLRCDESRNGGGEYLNYLHSLLHVYILLRSVESFN